MNKHIIRIINDIVDIVGALLILFSGAIFTFPASATLYVIVAILTLTGMLFIKYDFKEKPNTRRIEDE